MDNSEEVSLVKVDSNLIIGFIGRAKDRVLIAKPSLFTDEVEALKYALEYNNCSCHVFLEDGDNAVRLGFGETEALQAILKLSERVNMATADSIRLSLILVDDRALFFSPTALAWEKDRLNSQLTYPNGVLIAGDWVNKIYEIYVHNKPTSSAQIELPGNVIPFPVVFPASLDKKNCVEKLESAIQKLENNKPVDPTRLREIQFYRNQFKLVRIEVVGANVKTKSVSLRSFNKFFPERDERLKSSWQVFTVDEVKRLSSLTEIYNQLDEVKLSYGVMPVGRFGHLIEVSAKAEFEAEVKEIANKLKNPSSNKSIEESLLAMRLEANLAKSKTELLKYLMSLLIPDKNATYLFEKENSEIFQVMGYVQTQPANRLETAVKVFIDRKLRFPTSDAILAAVDIKLDYYDVSDELLNENVDFKKIMADREISKGIRDYSSGFTTL